MAGVTGSNPVALISIDLIWLQNPMRHLRLWMNITALATLCVVGCSNIEKADPTLAPKRAARPPIPLDVDPIMRGTVASETVVTGYQPVVVRGYGFVTGLKGTGSKTAPAEVRQYILREMARRGVGDPNNQGHTWQPEQLLSSEDSAIVIVEALIPAGAPRSTKFDIRVYAAPGTATTSLEGGSLWTTDLRPGVLLVGSKEAQMLAQAKGPIVINPFSDGSQATSSTINRLSGRVLNGGTSTKELPIKLVMATPSHSRARLIASAINSNYPREPTQRGETAQGMSGELIKVSVPPSWKNRSDHFVDLLRHTSVNVGPIDATAAGIAKAVTNNPGAAKAAAMRWEALGKKSLASIRPLYDYPEEQPRFAALEAGANLDDALVVPHLLALATSGSAELRVPAIRLLDRMSINPAIDVGLRPILNDSDIDVRLAAYEVLRSRGDPIIQRRTVGKKYHIDVVPSTIPMIYVKQSGEPTVVVFDEALAVKMPMTLRTWSGRLMFKADLGKDELEVFYRPNEGAEPLVDDVRPNVAEVTRFLGHSMDPANPAPGMSMSYSQVIGALYALWEGGYIPGIFKVEQDRILAAIAKAGAEAERTDRPEFIEDEKDPEAEAAASVGAAVPGLTPTVPAPANSARQLDPNAPRRDTVPR
ncbi:MAG: hypothetical protein EXS17_00845 [Phycisphaerales bacterium]|nr:hypothetical protein [Phycisphaerales bacterium]